MKAAFDKIGGVRPVVGPDFQPMMEAEVAGVESLIGQSLPTTYRVFLKAIGACGFKEYIEFTPSKQLPDVFDTGTGYVSVLYGSNCTKGYGLDERIRYFENRVPNGLIPIGDNGMGDQICLSVRASEKGAVFYWDLEAEPISEEEYEEDYGVSMPESEKWINVYRIADSFEDFIARLRVSND